ncbi:enolase-phosphatase E1-like protein [Dinothrombium tinctorium]|uniref:Enolase-phosphatase E1-like protein n=1 Tax=Dinothrombium tinctorium TaxID=1965070 RepID=A0A3S3QBV1_9ACAR|nr:enolase-phosphatase E1-like protein [Dinothrombium tinctorium]
MAKIQIKKAIDVILLDFPRIVKPDSFKDDILIPFFKEFLPIYLKAHWGDIDLIDIIRQLRNESNLTQKQFSECPQIAPTTSEKEEIIESVLISVRWHLSMNMITPPIMRLMACIWTEGYKKGFIKTEIYADVLPALENWHNLGLKVFSLSSSPVFEQKTLMTYSKFGNIHHFIDMYLDLNFGAKNHSATYIKLARFAHTDPNKVLFITDFEANAKAASAAGVRVILVVRNANANANSEFVSIGTLTDIEFTHSSIASGSSLGSREKRAP